MGCTQSKIENEEIVNRCKDRRQFMKDAVTARNAFAAAHSTYAVFLKNTGAALSDYAVGEVRHPHISSSSAGGGGASATLPSSAAQSHYEAFRPPPPLPNYPPSPLQRAASMPEISVHKSDLKRSDPIIEEENEEEIENESHSLKHRSSRSSGGGGGGGGSMSGVSDRNVEDEGLPAPPSPPRTDRAPPPPPPPESKGLGWDFFFAPMENVPAPSLAEVDEDRVEREEMERKMNEERAKKAAAAAAANAEVVDGGERRSVKAEAAEAAAEKAAAAAAAAAELPPQPPPAATKTAKKGKQVAIVEGKRGGKVPSNVNLLQIFSELDDCFLRASESAHDVSKMLEANRLHYHSNFADNRGHIDHSARVMRVITWNRSFRGYLNTDDGMDDFDSEEHETHATVLDKMLAWEKKLYDEVKAGEQMKFEYQKKVASLNKLKKRNASTESIEKTKAALSHLHTRYIVDMQSMDSTVLEINRLRDEQLHPKLVALVDGMGTMWATMRTHHENQSKIVIALKYLDISQSPEYTTDHHHERTLQLLAVVQDWQEQFERLMGQQKNYIKSLNNWLKLNLIPIDNNLKEKVSSPQRPQSPPIQSLLHAWHDSLEKIPEDIARTAISNFAGAVKTILQCQEEEMKLRDKCNDTQDLLTRKNQQFEDWYHKHMQRRTPPDGMDPEGPQEDELVAERRLVVETLQRRLEEEREAYSHQCIQVREKSLNSLKARLPELFPALSYFTSACSDMYGNLRSISQSHNLNGGS
ncbi:nitrate regulatory gene2 protein-like [Camellia sinensis]|uniref:DUF632 domain-containing protein n=1 Tax=Camellia sinensis var. sinensis TaxID=542762 RepID=A0A4S4E809_CAMSN|nr:nitrate regulatory gene2 protein-like [Camellia sinensis]THG11764.1 hypothetical protein TEA_026060 [Camellia sinensis var. sinensis]